MAVSYLSTNIYKSDPYTLPVDLGLMSKVLSVKQKEFDDNAQRIQSHINQTASLDILKTQDKDYVNNKLNNVVSQINNFGGVNLSDANVANQIDSMSSDIYNDPNVINAISSTKSIRSLQSAYQQYKTDPKLNKLYSTANEEFDMQHVNSYLSSDKVGDKYSGPATPTPYKDYRAPLLEAIKGVKANLTSKMTPLNDLAYYDETGASVTPERIMQMAYDLIGGDEQKQIYIDGWSRYKNYDPNHIIKASADEYYNKADILAVKKQEAYNNYQVSASDPKTALAYKKQYEDFKNQEDEMRKNASRIYDPSLGRATEQGIKDFQGNDGGFSYMGNLYMNQFLRGLSERFAYTENKNQLKYRQDEMFKLKYNQTENHFDQDMKFKEKQLQQQEDLALLSLGLKYSVGPDGKKTMVKVPPPLGNDQLSIQNKVDEPGDIENITENTLRQDNQKTLEEINKQESEFINGYLNVNLPNFSQTEQSTQSGSGITVKSAISDILSNFDNKDGLSLDDIKALKNPQLRELKINQLKNQLTAKGFGTKDFTGYTDEKGIVHPGAVAVIDNLVKAYDNLATPDGAKSGFKIPDGFKDMYEKTQMMRYRVEANNEKINAVTSTAMQNLKPADAAKIKEKQDAFDFFNKSVFTNGSIGNEKPGFSNFEKHLGDNDFAKKAYRLIKGGVAQPESPDEKVISTADFRKYAKYWDSYFNQNNSAFKTGNSVVDNAVKDYYHNVTNVMTFNGKPVTDDKTVENYIKPVIINAFSNSIGKSGDITTGENHLNFRVVAGDKNLPAGWESEKDAIQGVAIFPKTNGKGYYLQATINGKDKTTQTSSVIRMDLDPKNASLFGLYEDPYPDFSYVTNLKGASYPQTMGMGNDKAFTVRVVRLNPSSRDDLRTVAQVVENGVPIIVPGTEGTMPSESYQKIKTGFLNNPELLKLSREQIINYLQNR